MLLSNARGLVRLGLVDEVLDRILSLEADNKEEERLVWTTAAAILRYDGDALQPEQQARLREVQGRFFSDSLADQIRRYTGPFSIVEWSENEEERPEAKAATLAEEAFRDRDVIPTVLDWLVSNEAQQVWPFGFQLGFLDEGKELFETLRNAARRGSNPRVLSAYMGGRAAAGDSEWVDATLDAWAADAEMAALAFDASVTGKGSDRAVARMLGAVDAGWVDSRWLAFTRFGRWADSLSLDMARNLVEALLSIEDLRCVEAALAIVHDRLERAPDDSEIRSFAKDVLANPATWQRETMVSWLWGEIGKAVARDDPVGLAEVLVRAYLEGEASLHDSRLEVLVSALSAEPAEVLGMLLARLAESNVSHRLIWELESSNILADVPIEAAELVIKRTGADGARLLAQTIKPEPGRGDELLRFLLSRFFEEVQSILAINFITGSWTGPETGMIRNKLTQLETWLGDEDSSVREWATELRESLEKDLARAQLEEEEEDRY